MFFIERRVKNEIFNGARNAYHSRFFVKNTFDCHDFETNIRPLRASVNKPFIGDNNGSTLNGYVLTWFISSRKKEYVHANNIWTRG